MAVLVKMEAEIIISPCRRIRVGFSVLQRLTAIGADFLSLSDLAPAVVADQVLVGLVQGVCFHIGLDQIPGLFLVVLGYINLDLAGVGGHTPEDSRAQLVGEGGMIELWVPSKLGYGERGSPGSIPAHSDLHFIVELVNVD